MKKSTICAIFLVASTLLAGCDLFPTQTTTFSRISSSIILPPGAQPTGVPTVELPLPEATPVGTAIQLEVATPAPTP